MDSVTERKISDLIRNYVLYCAGIPVADGVTVPIPYVINVAEGCSVSIRHNPCFSSLWQRVLSILRRCEQDAFARRADNDNDCYCQGDIGKVKPEVAELFLRHVYTHEQRMLDSFDGCIRKYETESMDHQLLNVGKPRREELLHLIAEYKATSSLSCLLTLLLHVYGIGIDCSGFVSYILSHVMQQFGMQAREQEMTLGLESGFTKPSAIRLAREYRKELGLTEGNGGSIELFRYTTADSTGRELTDYAALLPGDVITKHELGHDRMSHIYVIIEVEKDERGLPQRIHAADSTSGKLRKGPDPQAYPILPTGIVDYRESEDEMDTDVEYVYRRPVFLLQMNLQGKVVEATE